MIHELENQQAVEPDIAASGELFTAIFRFLRIVQYRKNVILSVVCLFILMGVAYFALATRLYQSTAKLLIIRQQQDQVSTVGDSAGSDNTMATHRELVRSPIVLQQAIKFLKPEHRVDLQGVPQHKWADVIGNNLSAKTTRKTNFIEVSHRSKSPEAATAVVNAIIQSYLQFIEETHKGTAGDVIATLTKERDELHLSLVAKQTKLQQFRESVGHIAINSGDGIVEPIIQRAIHFKIGRASCRERV